MTNKITSKDVYTQEVGDLYDEVAVSCDPTHRDMLLDLAAEHGVRKGALVLDIGCANGGVSRKLLERTGCRIEGVELLKFLVRMGQEENKKLGVDDRFTIQQGTITDIPFSDNYFDLVFCNDVIGLVDDLPTALAECHRVLKPGGKMLIYASFGTDRLSDREAHELNESLGGAEKGLDIEHAEQCINQNFKLIQKTVIGSQFAQNSVEESKDKSEAVQNLLKVARLLTWPDKYIQKYGKQTYQIVLAETHWGTYILLGKLQPTVFIVQRI
jgi:ubiquinone/menaquinone biosynthesis C-methylase UbiE